MMIRFRLFGSMAASALLLGSAARAQVVSATVYGNVADPSGAAVVGATVVVNNELTGLRAVTTSNEQGEFTFASLQEGTYNLSIQATGFKLQRQSGISLAAGQRLRLSYTLELGAVTETVEVSAQVPLLSTVNAEQRSNLEQQQVRELPAFRRNWSELLKLTPGVTLGGIDNAQVSMNGLPPSGFRLTVDGTDNELDQEAPSLGMYQNFNFIKAVSLEAIAEVNVVRGVTSSEIGSMTGNVNITTNRGTNEFHGSLFENNQTENLAARQQFLRTKPGVVFNQFGGSLGGPIVRNKLFAFSVYEGYRLRSFQPVVGDVPTADFRARAIAAIPASKAYFELFDLPNQPHAAGAITGQFISAGSEQARDNHALTRVDYHMRDDTFLSARYTRGRPQRLIPRAALRNWREWSGINEAGTLSVNHTKAAWTSESRVGYNYNDTPRLDNIYALGIACIGGFGFGTCGEYHFKIGSTKTFEEVIGVTRGRHSVKFGGAFYRRTAGRTNEEAPSFNFRNQEEFLANIPNTATFTFGYRPFMTRSWQLGSFVQDDIKLRRNLILNLGLRYDYWSVPYEKDGRLFNRDSPLGLPGLGPLLPPDKAYRADRNNFSPRLGFAWTVDKAGKTVIRGGSGLLHSSKSLFGGIVLVVGNAVDEPFRSSFSLLEAQRFGVKYPFTNAQARPLVKGSGLISGNTISSNWPNPYSLQWMLSVQRQFTSSLALETGYTGTRGVKLTLARTINQVDRLTGRRPHAGFGQFLWFDTSASSYYHGWQTSLKKRLSRDFSFNINYVWASSISYDDGADLLGGSSPQDPENLRAEKGTSPFGIRHRFISDFLYELPFTRLAGASGRPARLLLGGWQFAGIFTAETGFPINLSQPSTFGPARPDYVGGSPYLSDYKQTLRYLNPNAFVEVPLVPASGAAMRPGSLGRMALRAPGLWNVDLALSKNLEMTERVRLQIRFDMFNSFNHTNFSGIVTNRRSATFGQLTGTRGARLMQVNLRLTF